MIQQIKTFLSKDNHTQWCVFLLFALTIFVKCVTFHWIFYHSLLLSSILNNPTNFIDFWGNKLMVSILVSSFVFLSKRYWWTIIANVLLDLWIIANLVYYQANECFLDINAILMVNNLNGFESSIKTFFKTEYIIFPLLSVIYASILFYLRCLTPKIRNIRYFALFISLCVCFHCCSVFPEWKRSYWAGKYDADFDMQNGRQIIEDTFGWNGYKMYIPFHNCKLYATPSFHYTPDYAKEYIRATSIVHYSIATVVYYINSDEGYSTEIVPEQLSKIIVPQNTDLNLPNTNLIMILVESFESWALEQGQLSQQVAANFIDFMESGHILYCNHVTSEAKHGVSGDGQMTLNTGLLPIYAGAACMMYGDNEYPNIASNYPHSMLVDISDGAWNQRQMTTKYGYKNECFRKGGMTEPEMFQTILNTIDTITEPYCIMGITITMHSPFNRYKTNHLTHFENVPHWFNDYMECLYYTDSCFGSFWKDIKNSELLKNTTIVVTGDHTVFKQNMLKDFSKFASSNGWTVPEEQSFVPLIIYSPNIKENVCITDTCYQMDIYPTIMHLIGCEDYYWKGFGVNLLDEDARHNRPISEQEAYSISDLLIRSNYFATHIE